MRLIGDVDSHVGLGPNDHLCWTYDDQAEYHLAATEFLAEGLDAGMRAVYVGSGPAEELHQHLGGIHDLPARLASGSVRVLSADELYGAGQPVDPDEVISRYAAATEEALADGYRGLRATADVTDAVRTAEQQDAFARYEFLIDRYIAAHPLSAMCAYRSALGASVRRFAALHPAAPAGLTRMRVFGCEDGAVGLAGEAELTSLDDLQRALEQVPSAGQDGLVIDLSRVTFADHRALLALSAFARNSRVPIAFRSVPAIARRVAALLGIELSRR